MKILKVIHGYPMRYNAGSEVYSQTLCHGLATRHEVHVFTREEDPFSTDYQLRTEKDIDNTKITLHLVNNPRLKDRYRVEDIDRRFTEVLDTVKPDIVHIGHLNHLSTSLLRNASAREIPIIYTLHDYWLMCPRGQFMQTFPQDANDIWAACDGQEDRKCAERCYARYFSGGPEEYEQDIAYWKDWVRRRMSHVREMTELVDMFIAPANYLLARYRDDFGLPEHKLTYLDYGFDRNRTSVRHRSRENDFIFGYIGTHIPAKGIHNLIQAFGSTTGAAKLRIWGRPRGQDTAALQSIAANLPATMADRIEWMPEYKNQNIANDVFDRIDAIVVPSVWVENSPLVIHEAQQARIPVITANVGGMAEYVQHEINGLLFEHRSPAALAANMQRFIDDPDFAHQLGSRGYLYSPDGDIPDIDSHIQAIESIYKQALKRRTRTTVHLASAPWRITFDTNPDTCNLRCVMCEEHSPHSDLQPRRKTQGLRHRRMSFDLIKKIVEEIAGKGLREIIPSTMGEPLLYEHFDDILTLCAKHQIKLNLTTNGTFPKHGARAWASRIVPVSSDVKISWNGANKETYESIMLRGIWHDALQNLREFIAVRNEISDAGGNHCRITLQVTFMESNVEELVDIVRLGIKLGVDRIKGHHLWAHFPEIETLSMRRNTDSIRRWNVAVAKVSGPV